MNKKKTLLVGTILLGVVLFQPQQSVFAATNSVQSDQPPSENMVLPQPLQQIVQESIPQRLEWVPKPQTTCHGFYVTQPLKYPLALTAAQLKGGPNSNPTLITADETKLVRNGVSVLQGHVVITQVGQELQADLAFLYPDPKSKNYQIQYVDLFGHVRIKQADKILVGNSAHYNLQTKAGIVYKGIYRLNVLPPKGGEPVGANNSTKVEILTDKQEKLLLPVGWGSATTITQIDPNLYHLVDSSYSTCNPAHPEWEMQSTSMDLNKITGRGQAWNTLLYLNNWPIFYMPYMNFPIDDRRTSGFLYPTIGNRSKSGVELSVPFYFNLLPNVDATLTPELMTERGLMTNGNVRFLTDDSHGQFLFGFIPQDQGFKNFQSSTENNLAFTSSLNPTIQARLNNLENDSSNRGMLSLQDVTNFNSDWTATVNFNWVSDYYYLNDFGGNLNETTLNQLPEQAELQYAGQHWNFLGNIQNYQTLHPVNQASVLNAYTRLPQLQLNGDYPGILGNFDFGINSEYDDFVGSKNPGQPNDPAEGSRFTLYPSLSLPLTWGLKGYLTPKVQLEATQYDLYNTGVQNPFLPQSPTNPGRPDRSPSLVVPIVDVDSGLYFDRDTDLFGHDFTQTLEPRIFYLFVPLVKQSNIPLFDTSYQAFDYSTLFQTNRFTGLDRQTDANQVTFALSTRFLDNATGEEKATASIGDIVYFRNQDVTLCRTANCKDPTDIIGVLPSNEPVSPIAGQVTYDLAKHWHANLDAAYDPTVGGVETADVGISYKSDNQHIFNISYSFLKNGDTLFGAPGSPSDALTIAGHTFVQTPSPDRFIQSAKPANFNQPFLSFAWPIMRNWSTIGYYSYDIAHSYAMQYFIGLQYESCCYATRIIWNRQFQNLNQNNRPVMQNAFYVQFLFKGMGSVGNANPQSLVQSISGYKDPFGSNFL